MARKSAPKPGINNVSPDANTKPNLRERLSNWVLPAIGLLLVAIVAQGLNEMGLQNRIQTLEKQIAETDLTEISRTVNQLNDTIEDIQTEMDEIDALRVSGDKALAATLVSVNIQISSLSSCVNRVAFALEFRTYVPTC